MLEAFLVQKEVILKLVLSAVIGGIIGFEREKRKRPAGLRTHMLVCLGSCLITLVSMEIFPEDPARVMAGIVTGIGFLGAGTIFRQKDTVRGLTTAANLWLVSGVGMAVGTGFYVGAITTTILALIILFLNKIEKKKFR